MSRAGLISFIFLSIFTGLATSAPLRGRPSIFDNHHENQNNDLVTGSPFSLNGREYYIVDPEYTTREYDMSPFDERDLDELEYTERDDFNGDDLQERGFFSSLKHDLGKAAHVALKADTIGLKVASKGLKFVPGVGKGVATAAGIASKGTNALANNIQRRDELEYTERDDFTSDNLQERGFFSSLKHDLGKAAHVALKADTIGLKVASKGLKFVPGVGKGVATAAGLASKGTNALANNIQRRGFFKSLKHDLGKAAHVALKADTIGLKVASKGLKFVPGVGNGIATAAGLASKGTNALANNIQRRDELEYTERDDFTSDDLQERGFFSSLKHDLGKAAHVALKADTIGLKVASKGLKFVPGVGKGVATAAGIASKGTNALANNVHRRSFVNSVKHDLNKGAHDAGIVGKTAAKGALKMDATGLTIASQGLKFIPDAGEGAAAAAGILAKGANGLSNAIPANLGTFGKDLNYVTDPSSIKGKGGQVVGTLLGS